MIGVQAIGTYIPARRIDNRNRMDEFNIDETFLLDKTGMLGLSVKNENEETSDLCCKAFKDLIEKSGLKPEEVECVVVCTQNPDGAGLPHTSAIVHGKLGLSDDCAVFDISLGCSGFVYGLSVIQGFMQENGFRKGVLFTADPYSKIIDPKDRNSALLFGDAATATLISDTPIWQTGKFKFGSHGKQNSAIKNCNLNNRLEMNGRAVFSFSATTVPQNIISMLEANHLTVKDVDSFALHQGSRFIVDTISQKLGAEEGQVPFVAADYGNTVSSSIPLLLNAIGKEAAKVVVGGFGVGLSWGSTILFKVNQE